MQMTEQMMLPVDLLLTPIKDLPEHVRRQVEAEDGDFALTRPNSRAPSRIIGASAAELLQEFRSPVTIVDAVIRYSRERQLDPEQILEEAFPMLERLAGSRLLVPSSSDEAKRILPSLEIASRFQEFEVVRCLQSLDDTELYQLMSEDGQCVALKLGRKDAPLRAQEMFRREAAMLMRLEGASTPRLLREGVTDEGQRFLLMEWCSGTDCASAAASLRQQSLPRSRRELLALCSAILEAYTHLHEKNVIHSDIHPRNVLVDDAGGVKLIDFGYARVSGIESEFRRAQRSGVAFFFEPEYASSVLRKGTPPASSALGEQYALAALLYSIVTGSHYIEFSLEKDEMLRQIAEDPPLPFARRNLPAWPEFERVLAKALCKRPADRFSDIAEFALALAAVAREEARAAEEDVATAAMPDAQDMLRSVLARIDVGGELFANGLVAPRTSVTYGSAGIAYACYRIACSRDDPRLLAAADVWVTRSVREAGAPDAFYNAEIEITPEIVGRVSPYHNASGIHLVQLLIARAQGDLLTQQTAMQNFMAAGREAPCESLDVTLGRSGVLLGSAILLNAINGCKYLDATPITAFGNDMLREIWAELETFRSIRECRQISYSGAAHGWAGILFATMNWCKVSGTELPASMMDRLEQLGKMVQSSGRTARWAWSIRPSGLSPGGSAYMPGWCNGSAGFVFLWTLAHRMLGRPEYASLAEGAAFGVWETESPIGNLCCGFAGQAYALLNMYKHTGENTWLYRAQALAQKAAQSIRDMAPGSALQDLILRRDSLYKGELGIALLTEELDRPDCATMPLYELEG